MAQKIIDTNVIIRFLTDDSPELTSQAEEIIQQAQPGQLLIPDVVIAEIIWVLLSFYKLSKNTIIDKLESMIACDKFDLNRPLLKPALQYYRKYNISFIDAYLLALSQHKEHQLISFDNDLNKVLARENQTAISK